MPEHAAQAQRRHLKPVKPTFQYSVTGTGSTNVKLDGIWLDVTYTVPGRGSGTAVPPTTSTPAVPGGVRARRRPRLRVHGGVSSSSPATATSTSRAGRSSSPRPRARRTRRLPSTTRGRDRKSAHRRRSGRAPEPARRGSQRQQRERPSTARRATTRSLRARRRTTRVRTISLSAYTPAMRIPNGSTAISFTARIAHSETGGTGSTARVASTTSRSCLHDTTSGAAISGCTIPVSDSGSTGTVQTPTVPAACLTSLTIAQVNAGIRADYNVTYQCSSSCGTSTYTESLDGVEFVVGWTPPASGGGVGSIPGSSGASPRCRTTTRPITRLPTTARAHCCGCRPTRPAARTQFYAVYGTVYARRRPSMFPSTS